MSKRAEWSRNLWAVRFIRAGKPEFLVGEAWHHVKGADYPGQPSRCLLFHTRAKARAWAKDKTAWARAREDDISGWSFRVEKVREVVFTI